MVNLLDDVSTDPVTSDCAIVLGHGSPLVYNSVENMLKIALITKEFFSTRRSQDKAAHTSLIPITFEPTSDKFVTILMGVNPIRGETGRHSRTFRSV